MLIKNKSKKHSELFKNTFILKNSPFLNVTPFVFFFYIFYLNIFHIN